ncbi:MAG TPA: four helix bundle protein [Chitinophagaceae bacterium]|nr:four helix bundle protein [Chitinophagaceae bacterium]
MTSEELKGRTKLFAIKTARLIQELNQSNINRAYCAQLVRSSSSVGANYRAARRAKSRADFINKLKIVEEELDESQFFLELLLEFNSRKSTELKELISEAETLLKIIVATINAVRRTVHRTS